MPTIAHCKKACNTWDCVTASPDLALERSPLHLPTSSKPTASFLPRCRWTLWSFSHWTAMLSTRRWDSLCNAKVLQCRTVAVREGRQSSWRSHAARPSDASPLDTPTFRTCLERGSRMDFKTLNLKGVLWNNLANRELSHQGKHRCLLHGSCCCRTHDPESQAVLCEDTVQECKLHGLQGSFACRGIPINGPLQPPTATSEGCALLPLGGRFRSRISSSAANTSTTIPHQSAPGKSRKETTSSNLN